MMSEPSKYREWILETIDSLRSRKARPDLERICRMLRRRHGSDPDRTRTELEKLIQEQAVLKVSYKGSISYRNAAKVQRKSRRKSDFVAEAGGCGAEGAAAAAAAAARERAKHLNNNGDSAHSFTDQGEGEEPEPSPDPHTQAAGTKLTPAGNGFFGVGGGGATTDCTEETASAPRDEGTGDGDGTTPSTSDVCGAGKHLGPSGTESQKKTCLVSVSSLPQPQPAPKLRVGGAEAETRANSPDREASALRPSERSLPRGGSSSSTSTSSSSTTATRGHAKPLGLKEILGYLSSQERLSEEKLTRGKVKVVMEREVARGRLRRTRCGNITLPLRGAAAAAAAAEDASADRLERTAAPDGRLKKPQPSSSSVQRNEPMETGCEEEAQDGDDPRSSDEEGGPAPVAMTTEPGLTEKPAEDAAIQAVSKHESPHQQQPHGGIGPHSLTMTPSPPDLQGASLSPSGHPEDTAAALTRHGTQDQPDMINRPSLGFSDSECKTEIGVSSCLLTPTASPRDSSLSEERGMDGGVNSEGLIKSEGASGSPVDWTVSDVVSYFTAAGFPEQAAAFSTQEIDGKSLLLMQRHDVLTGLSIRLGPALKIYEGHVKVLQRTHFEDDDC